MIERDLPSQPHGLGKLVQPVVPPPRLVFWETTKACNLRCQHCRAVAEAYRGAVTLMGRTSTGT